MTEAGYEQPDFDSLGGLAPGDDAFIDAFLDEVLRPEDFLLFEFLGQPPGGSHVDPVVLSDEPERAAHTAPVGPGASSAPAAEAADADTAATPDTAPPSARGAVPPPYARAYLSRTRFVYSDEYLLASFFRHLVHAVVHGLSQMPTYSVRQMPARRRRDDDSAARRVRGRGRARGRGRGRRAQAYDEADWSEGMP